MAEELVKAGVKLLLTKFGDVAHFLTDIQDGGLDPTDLYVRLHRQYGDIRKDFANTKQLLILLDRMRTAYGARYRGLFLTMTCIGGVMMLAAAVTMQTVRCCGFALLRLQSRSKTSQATRGWQRVSWVHAPTDPGPTPGFLGRLRKERPSCQQRELTACSAAVAVSNRDLWICCAAHPDGRNLTLSSHPALLLLSPAPLVLRAPQICSISGEPYLDSLIYLDIFSDPDLFAQTAAVVQQQQQLSGGALSFNDSAFFGFGNVSAAVLLSKISTGNKNRISNVTLARDLLGSSSVSGIAASIRGSVQISTTPLLVCGESGALLPRPAHRPIRDGPVCCGPALKLRKRSPQKQCASGIS